MRILVRAVKARKIFSVILMAGLLAAALALAGAAGWADLRAQQPPPQAPVFRVKVDLVVLSVSVTNRQGRYVTGLKPPEFRVLEDGILQKVAFFGEGNQTPVTLEEGRAEAAPSSAAAPAAAGIDLASDTFVGTNVFVLFDTSNFMYRGFVYAEDAIADFVRGLERDRKSVV